MRITETFVLLLFLAVFAATYVSASWLLIGALLRRLRGRPAPKLSTWARRRRRGVLVLAAVGILCMAYGHFIEPYWLKVRHERIVSVKLATDAAPVRIAHISDLHCDGKVRLEDRVVEAIAALKPDLIAFTGDCSNSSEGMENFRKCMSGLAAIAPTYVVRGNWDVGWPWCEKLFEGTGAVELDGKVVKVSVGSSGKRTEIWLAGADYTREGDIPATCRKIPPGALKVLLYHVPDQIEPATAAGVDLYLAGHTHGGQVALPFYGALVTLSRYGKRFESGLYNVDGMWLNVNPGIGMEGSRAPRIRFCARPEITLIEVAGKE